MNPGRIIASVIGFFGILVVLILCFGSWGTVPTGHRGVVLRMHKVTNEIKGEGFYTKTPWVETVHDVNVRTIKAQDSTEAASHDLQTVTAEVALNVNIKPASVATIYQTYGDDPFQVVVDPAVKESIKAVIPLYRRGVGDKARIGPGGDRRIDLGEARSARFHDRRGEHNELQLLAGLQCGYREESNGGAGRASRPEQAQTNPVSGGPSPSGSPRQSRLLGDRGKSDSGQPAGPTNPSP